MTTSGLTPELKCEFKLWIFSLLSQNILPQESVIFKHKCDMEAREKVNKRQTFWDKRGRGRCMELREVKFSAKEKTKQTKGELSPNILCLGGVKYWASPVAQWERTDFCGKIADIDQFHLNIYVLVNRKPPEELISYGNPVSLRPSTSCGLVFVFVPLKFLDEFMLAFRSHWQAVDLFCPEFSVCIA